jgi:Zn-dependent protease
MSISAILYGFAFGSWYFALGFVLLLFIHEYGHIIAMRRKGISASAPVFIPFLGAAIFAEIPKNKEDEAYIGYGGPLLGTLGAIVCILVALILKEGSFSGTLLHLLGNVGLFINLFNLIPARPLDGGRILHLLGDWVVYCGFLLLLIFAFVAKDVAFIFFAILTTENMLIRKVVKWTLFGIFFTTVAGAVLLSFDKFLDVAFFCFFVFLAIFSFLLAWVIRKEPLVVSKKEDEIEPTSFGVKAKWVLLYLVLLVGIFGTMVWHSQYLPKEIAKSAVVDNHWLQ